MYFFFRAKRIQNKAVVNEGPTERLVRELKAENAKLLLKLSKLDQNGRQSDQEMSEDRENIPELFPTIPVPQFSTSLVS